MKTIILIRHSIPERLDIPTETLPLSDKGRVLAVQVKERLESQKVDKCFSSPYLRAYETANILFDNVNVINNLHERTIGNAKEDFWLKQYSDYHFKNEGGESLNEVKVRMFAAMNEILQQTKDNETVLVVSHATAICSYLLNYCEIEVVDVPTKSRKIIFNDKEILCGKIEPMNYFVLEVGDGNEMKNIRFVGKLDKCKN